MGRFDATLTPNVLNIEYVEWFKRQGNGRDKRDQRFGQYLITKYLSPMQAATDIFYLECAADVFILLYIELKPDRNQRIPRR